MKTIQIDKHDSRLNAVKFLTSCMIKDNRFHCKHFRVEQNGNAVATDGNRLHFVSELPLEAGYYQVHKNNKASVLIEKAHELDTQEGSYPDYADLLTVPNGDGETEMDIMFSDNVSGCDVSGVYTKIVRAMESTTLNFDFVSDLYSALESKVVTCTIPADEKNGRGEIETCKPVHFVLNGYHAVIMPIRID